MLTALAILACLAPVAGIAELARQETSQSPSVFVMFSTGLGQAGLDRLNDSDPDPNSIYTRVLLRHLADPGRNLVELATDVQAEVGALAAEVGYQQTSAYYAEGSAGAFVLTPTASEAPKGKRLAFVVGMGDYPNLRQQSRPLSAHEDAAAMTAKLQSMGFSVVSATDLGRAEFNEKLEAFLQGLAPGDVAAFYFSGLGLQIDGNNYLLPADISTANLEDGGAKLARQAIQLSSLVDAMTKRQAGLTLIILDAARDNPFAAPAR
ncbi:caspase family protein [Methyloceanibacter sp.]|uniref:caspase family protein n=1 Tax=Methyloceanibacter sp. TaxID=1965321 RepID=UPI003D6CBB28